MPTLVLLISALFSPLAFANCEGSLTQIARALAPIAEPIPMETVYAELENHATQLLDTTPGNSAKGYKVYLAEGREIPQTVLELGRLREITFRTVDEGSGLARDNDSYDPYYMHFVCIDKKTGAISGAYRMGKVDEILRELGPKGVYSFSFFDFHELLNDELKSGALDMGRSFVRTEYQKGLTLSVLWAGIGKFLSLNPEYRHLIGPVSISGRFLDDSKKLMMDYLMKNLAHPRAGTVTPRQPPRLQSRLTEPELEALVAPVTSISELERAVRKTENNDTIKIPPLIRMYVDMNVRFLGFNWDADFNALDGLIWTDASKLSEATLSKYMGQEGAARYLKAQSR